MAVISTKPICALAALLFLAGCLGGGTPSNRSTPQASEGIAGTVRGLLGGTPQIALDPRFIAAQQKGSPAQVVSVQGTNMASAFYKITQNADGIVTWLTGNTTTFSTDTGIIVATRGFSNDIQAADVARSRDLILARTTGQAPRVMSHFIGDNTVKTTAYMCQITPQGPWPITIGSQAITPTLMQEDCTNGTHSLRNLYWVETQNGSARIVQSRQWINGTIGAVVTQIAPKDL